MAARVGYFMQLRAGFLVSTNEKSARRQGDHVSSWAVERF